MARTIAGVLASDPRYQAVLAHQDFDALREPAKSGLQTLELSGAFRESLSHAFSGAHAVVCTITDARLPDVAEIAQASGCHYVDIAEDPSIAQLVASRAGGQSCVVPACGLAPGYVTALAGEMLARCDEDADLAVRVGVLPAKRSNRLGYGLMWSIDGLITEYTAPCLAIRGGKLAKLDPLQELEEVSLAGEAFEAFTTAGSLDGLMRHQVGRVENLIFKTLRYPGHLDYMRFLIHDLGLGRRLYQLRNLLMNGLPAVSEDRVIISLVLQPKSGQGEEHFLQTITASRDGAGNPQSAVSIATAAHTASVVDIVCSGLAPHKGFLDLGELPPALLRRSRFFTPLIVESAAR